MYIYTHIYIHTHCTTMMFRHEPLRIHPPVNAWSPCRTASSAESWKLEFVLE